MIPIIEASLLFRICCRCLVVTPKYSGNTSSMGSVCEASCVEELGILGAWASAVLVVSSVLQDETAGRLEFEILSVALSRVSGCLVKYANKSHRCR